MINKISMSFLSLICIIAPIVAMIGFYCKNEIELSMFFGFIIGIVAGVSIYQYSIYNASKKISQYYKDTQIKIAQSQEELAMLFQKELEKMGIDVEVIFDANGNLNIDNPKNTYYENEQIQKAFDNAQRQLSLRMIKRS